MKIEIGEFVPVWVEIEPKLLTIIDDNEGQVKLCPSELKRLRDILNDLKL